jgi:hypothetical protein
MQTLQTDYFATYRNLKLSRDAKGVVVAEFHSDGGPFITFPGSLVWLPSGIPMHTANTRWQAW